MMQKLLSQLLPEKDSAFDRHIAELEREVCTTDADGNIILKEMPMH